MNNCTLTILLVIFIFTVFICLKKNKIILEGAANIETQEQRNMLEQQAREYSSQGLCRDENGNFIHPQTEKSCIGDTGFKMEYITIGEKRTELSNINAPDDIIENEVKLKYGDVVTIVDVPDIDEGTLFIYRGDEINLDSYEGNIALFPYSHEINGQEKLEYCYNENGFVESGTDQSICQSETNDGYFFLPVYDPNNEKITQGLPLKFKSSNCRMQEGINRTEAGVRCFNKSNIKISHCTSKKSDSDDDFYQIKPGEFWKTQYQTGSNKTVEEICEGTRTNNTWIANSGINYFMDSQVFAEISSQIESTVNNQYNTDFEERFPQTQQGVILPDNLQQLAEQQISLRNALLDAECSFQNQENIYHGNLETNASGEVDPSSSTHKMYDCPTGIDPETPAGSLRENCSNEELVCNNNFAKDNPNGIIKQITCTNGTFRYHGCVADTCKLPDDFSEKYVLTTNHDPNNITIYNVTDVLQLENQILGNEPQIASYIRCQNGFSGTPMVHSCKSTTDENGVVIPDNIVISGCEENICTIPDDIGNYDISDTRNQTSTEFKQNHGMNESFNIDNQLFKCRTPNSFYLNDEKFPNFMDQALNTDITVNNITDYPKANCVTVENADGTTTSTFEFQGCYPNQCLNPLLENNNIVYESVTKPLHFEDTVFVSDYASNKYEKYVYSDISNTTQTINKSQVNDKIKCGKNYTLTGQTLSDETADKTLPNENIKCYNFYDYGNLTDESNTDVPSYKYLNADGSINEDPVPAFTDFKGWVENQGTNVRKILPFTVSGCESNYCKWPTTQPGYNKPRSREGQQGLQNQSNERFQLGYKYTTDDLGTSTVPVDQLKTAREFAQYDENTGQVSLECVGGDNIDDCEIEPIFTNEEIDEMLTNVEPEKKSRGQPTLLTSSELDSVGRGGQFEIARCWTRDNPDVPPEVSCNGIGCNSEENSECEATVSGCTQNMCKLNLDDATNGTNILIESSDGQYMNIGGILGENIDYIFNVDQIRNITCDENYSKPTTNPSSERGPYGGGDNFENIKISCGQNNDYFTIENKCSLTQCSSEVSDIDDLINLTSYTPSLYSTCPGINILASYEAHLPDDTAVTPFESIEAGLSISICKNETNQDEILNYNKSRYKWDGNNFTCEIPDDLTSEQIGLTSNGTVTEKCNYQPNNSSEPKRAVKGCQPRLCTLPDLSGSREDLQGYIYNTEIYPPLLANEKYSTDSILNRNYYSGDKPNYLSDEEYQKMISSQEPISCNTEMGYNGTVNIACPQTDQEYLSNITPEFILTGCSENQCTLPENIDNIIYNVDNVNIPIQLSELLDTANNYQNIKLSCPDNFSVNPDSITNIKCETPDGEFSGLSDYCVPNICSIPSNINVSERDVYQKRLQLKELNTIGPNASEDVLSGLSDELRSLYTEVGGEDNENMFNYLTSVGMVNPEQNVCYTSLNEIANNSYSMEELNERNIQCDDNCMGNVPALSCPNNNEDFSISGCEEKYCRLPVFNDSAHHMYNFGTAKDRMKKLEEVQGIGITSSQVSSIFDSVDQSLRCATYSNQTTPPTMECLTDGETFTLSGCSLMDRADNKTYSNGSVIYSYYPSPCNIIKDNAFIYLSGTEVFNTETENKGRSITHRLSITDPVSPSETEFYYYKPRSEQFPEAQYLDNPPTGYEEPTDPLGDWNGWKKIPYHINYDKLSDEQINENMKDFMNTSKDICDKIVDCTGFNISSFNRLTSEIVSVEQAGARNDEDGTINVDVLREYITNPENNYLELGTHKSEQKDQRCIGYIDNTVVGIHDTWGQTTDGGGGNSYIYNSFGGEDVLNYKVIPENEPIYFKQIVIGTSDDNRKIRGYTNKDEPGGGESEEESTP